MKLSEKTLLMTDTFQKVKQMCENKCYVWRDRVFSDNELDLF